MEKYCVSLNLPAVPHLGIYNPLEYSILTIEHITEELIFSSLPVKLSRELIKIQETLNHSKVDYLTTVNDGRWLKSSFPHNVNLNILLQPYVFHNVPQNQNHQATVKSSVYKTESLVSKTALNACEDCISIDSQDIYSSDLFTCIHTSNRNEMCCSPNNAKIKVFTSVPLQVFYSLTLVPFDSKVSRVLVTKHVLVIDESSEIGGLAYRLALTEDTAIRLNMLNRANELLTNLTVSSQVVNAFENLIEVIVPSEGRVFSVNDFWKNKVLYFLVWKASGRPQADNFGEAEWQRLLNLNSKWSCVAAKAVLESFVHQVILWLSKL